MPMTTAPMAASLAGPNALINSETLLTPVSSLRWGERDASCDAAHGLTRCSAKFVRVGKNYPARSRQMLNRCGLFEHLQIAGVRRLRGRSRTQKYDLGRNKPRKIVKEGRLAIVLDTGRAQASKAMSVDGTLPAQEFVYCKSIVIARLIEAQKTAANGSDDLGLAADYPALGVFRGKVGNRQRTSIRPNNIPYARPVMFCHGTLTRDPIERESTSQNLKFA